MSQLASFLMREIGATGAMSLGTYMAQCLCHPKYGYYMKQDPFGAAGDFTTAPEISQMFGELVGLWTASVWQQMGNPKNFRLVELGPGRGTLMQDVLRATRGVPGFHAAMDVHLVDVSPVLRMMQKTKLENCGVTVSWHENFADVPDGPALFIANEFFDALPVRQFEKGETGWCERCVDIAPSTQDLRLVLRPDEAAGAFLPEGLEAPTRGDVIEASPMSRTIAHGVGERLAAQGGAILVLDYGYEVPGFGDTLQAVKGHEYTDILSEPGTADLSAHVDFTTLGRCFEQGGAKVFGPLTQGEFLERLGIAQRAQILLKSASDEQRKNLVAAHRRLVHPEEMGQLFKVMCALHPDQPAPAAFEEGEL